MRFYRHNAWVSLIALLLCVLILVFAAGCSDQTAAAEPEPTGRFTMEKAYDAFNDRIYIVTDTDTDAQYLYIDGYEGVGVTKLEPAADINAGHTEPEKEPTVEITPAPESDVEILAKLVWGEARGCSKTEQAAVVWCVLNRVDSDLPYFPDTIREVVLQENAFAGYSPENPVTDELVALVQDVLCRWELEQYGVGYAGRVLPATYTYFHGDGTHNYFRMTYEHTGLYWEWVLGNPYNEEV